MGILNATLANVNSSQPRLTEDNHHQNEYYQIQSTNENCDLKNTKISINFERAL